MDLIQKAKNLGCVIKNEGYYLWEIQKWLRDKHSLHIEITNWEFEEWYIVIKGYVNGKRVHKRHFNQIGYDSFEEALEKGLQESFKIIQT